MVVRPTTHLRLASEDMVLLGEVRAPEAPALVESYRRLAEVFHDVMSEQSLDALLDRIAETLSELMPYEALHIYEANDARRELVPVLARSPEYEEEIMNDRPSYDEGLTGWAVSNLCAVFSKQSRCPDNLNAIFPVGLK